MNVVMIGIGSVLLFNIVLASVKLVVSGNLPVKVVILDVLTTVVTGLLVLLGIIFDSEFLLDIALIYAVLAFASVLVVARTMEKGV